MFDSIVTHIRKHAGLTDAEADILTSLLTVRDVKKKEHLLEAGKVCTEYYFVAEGCFRMYLVTAKGAEQVIQFGIEDWWINDYASYKTGLPSGYCIQAVEKAKVIVLDKKNEEEMFTRLPQMERYFRRVAEKAYSAQLNRIHYIFNLSGEEQYHLMNSRHPQFVQRVPQYMLASFLGITPEFLSKLRAKK
ncbi:Crp/Fnr family transcriptional regulator [Flavobacterium sp. DG1-102-2]|uniref:Crp/Fnr family transcriptional regulator n=1 Tax=Flavobacterium sp. DG1-102-2 TaxID=3081663 RepID=UPI0029492709|nr:Crp/Fnr family transcriptional regulator [Flavobacterium sp. DG1-102-2]MDV6169062.1 Crp/Fnr family transcriptional regulator [Flavobacterium sp. DG1-102-2]